MHILFYAILIVANYIFLVVGSTLLGTTEEHATETALLSSFLNIPLILVAALLIKYVIRDARFYWALSPPLISVLCALYLWT